MNDSVPANLSSDGYAWAAEEEVVVGPMRAYGALLQVRNRFVAQAVVQ